MSIVLGFDLGERRIGWAVGNRMTGTSRAQGWLQRQGNTLPWSELENAVTQWAPERLLVGIPLTEDGGRQPMTRKARHFAQQLRERLQLPVSEVDERYSSASAERELASARRSGGKTRRLSHGDTDSMAAAIIVQQWLDST